MEIDARVGLTEIGIYLPTNVISNYDRKEAFSVDDSFIENKLGVKQTTIKDPAELASDLAFKAVEALEEKREIDRSTIECLIVVTQNPDYNIPHSSAILHGKLGLASSCAAFDISLGCSGYVYGLSVIESFMQQNGMTQGILVTSDPYSAIVDPTDKNTAMLFGDAATATLITNSPTFVSGQYTFGTIGTEYEALICRNKRLTMNGRGVFNFAAQTIPSDVLQLLKKNNRSIDDVDKFLFHQGSRYLLQTIAARLRISSDKALFAAAEYGNTISSSIPIMFESLLHDDAINTVVLSGFGVGLSWSSGICYRYS